VYVCYFSANGQKDTFIPFKAPKKCHKRVGYFASLKPEKLARKLTANLQSDSEKVAAIHCWMTSHISYDVDKYLTNDFIVKSNKNILRRRKAICYGYATLFKELCMHAGIQAVIVTGYTKNQDIDICDSFYLEDHAWNAFYINNRWYLSDLTWDAGYMKQWKRNFFDQIVYVLTWGKKDHIRNKIHFIKSPRWEFYMKPGEYFFYDHIPANPIWQLMDPIQTIDDFKTDSSYYYLKPRDSSDSYSSDFEAERQIYFSNEDTLNDINDGFAFVDYNFRNHYQIIISNQLLSKPFNDALNFKSKDTVFQLQQADSVISYCGKSLLHADSNVYYLKEQLQMQLKHVALKNNTLKQQNNTLNKSAEKTMNQARKGLRIKVRLDKYIKTSQKINRKNLNITLKDNKIYSSRSARQNKLSDSSRLAQKIASLDSTIKSMKLLQDSLMAHADTLLKSIFPKLQTCIDFQQEKRYEVMRAVMLRKYGGFDDLDYPIRQLKDTLMLHNETHDSDLFSGKKLIYDSLYKTCRAIQDNYKVLGRTYKFKLGAIRQLKTKCAGSQSANILKLYNDELKDMTENLAFYELWQKDFMNLLDSSQSGNKLIKQKARQTIRWIQFEKQFRIKDARFRKRNKALLTLNKFKKQETGKQLRKAKKVKKNFSRVKPT